MTGSIAEIFETMEYGPAPESDRAAREWLKAHRHRFTHFIGGEWHVPATAEYFETINPADGRPLADIAQAGAADIDAAVAAAQTAQPRWWELGPHGRARYLYALARQVQKHARLLAVLESLDNGKPIRETRDIDIPLVARHFYHHAGWAQLMEQELPGYRPLGVVGQIIPWNFPLLMLAWKIAPALAMGNTVVLKPAEYTPLTALAFAELCQQINLPPGVLNIVTGDGRSGELIVRHPGIQKIAFTGSTEVGRLIREATAGSGKRLSLELGGKSPFIVCEDADLDSAIEGLVDAIWFNQGQVCCAGSRLLAQESIAPRLEQKLRQRMERLRIGDPLDKAIDIGAIIAPVQLQKIQSLVEQGRREGAEIWQPGWSCPAEGYFYPPTLCTNVAPSSTLAQVEIFGPVLVMLSFRTPAEAVALANNTRYGLAASIWSENINLALDLATQVQAGTIWINSTNLFDAAAGFGGYRESGYGREGGREGLFEYVSPTVTALTQHSVDQQTEQANGLLPDQTPFDLPALNSPLPPIDRTAKLFIGGKQVRPDSGYSTLIRDSQGMLLGEVGTGNRKDIRNAVEAAHAASGWARSSGHARAQVLYYLAENLETRAAEFVARIARMTGNATLAYRELQLALERIFVYAAWADKYDGAIHSTPLRGMTLAVHEPIGVIGLVCPQQPPLLGMLSLLLPAIALGNRVVLLPSEPYPLAASDLYQVFETSDLPAGVVNIVTGPCEPLAKVLAEHDDVDALWYFGPQSGISLVERASTGNLKRCWAASGSSRDWFDPQQGAGHEFLRQATQIKNIWIPYGE